MNLLSIGAAYGVVAYLAEGGWAGQLVGIDTPTPVPPFIPVIMFAILFGLSMDYEVFLLAASARSTWRGRDTARAVTEGLARTARVITAAALIMVAVFGAFALSPEVFLKLIGIGLATAILIDATIVRMVLVPAVMQLLGDRNWWLPRWLGPAAAGARGRGAGRLGEQREGGLALAAQHGEVDLDPADPARLREHPRLRLDHLRREHAAALAERGVEPDPLEVAAQLLDRVDRADALDLDRDPAVVVVAAHEVDRADVGRPLAAHEPEALAAPAGRGGQRLLQVGLDPVLLEAGDRAPCRAWSPRSPRRCGSRAGRRP